MGEHDMYLIGWTGDNGDPDNFLNMLWSARAAENKPSQNRSFWKNEEFTKLIKEAEITSDIAKRTALYEKAQVIFKEEAPAVLIANSIIVEPMLKKVHGFKLDFAVRRFKDVYMEK